MNDAIQLQSDIIRKNILAITAAQHRENASLSLQEKIAGAITAFSGSMAFVYIHAIWFGLWILLNVGLINIPPLSQFDPYPFGFLTLVVSLEAIFLSTFVLIAQNRLARQSEKRAELDLQINLLAEQKAAKVLEMLEQMVEQLDHANSRFNLTLDEEVKALKVSPQPEEVLDVIEKAINDETNDDKQSCEKSLKKMTEKEADSISDRNNWLGKIDS
ncbi:MAG: DUF1003 domain-containing protein [Acidobacteria bacterium]|nr:DUF1003 domain-containing protein [Acidobacteriota bacterium]